MLLGVVLLTGYRRVVSRLRPDTETGGLKLAYVVVGIVYNLTEAGLRIFSPTWIVFLVSIIAVPKARAPKATGWQTGTLQLWPEGRCRDMDAAVHVTASEGR